MLIKNTCCGVKMRYVLAVLLWNLTVITSALINYCGSKMCGHTDDHTLCMYPHSAPGLHCTGYIHMQLTPREKAELLYRLNTRRNAAASGRLRGFPPAGNMLKLRWVGELEREAQIWADQCSMPSRPEKHDICRELYATSVGQCAASVVGEAPGLRPETMIDMWYMQSINYKGDVNTYINPQDNNSYYGDFAQILHYKTYMVGCARSKFMAILHNRVRSVERLVCNFAPQGPFHGRAIWIPSKPASICPPRAIQDNVFPALCDFQSYLDESQDQDHVMTLEEHLLLDSVFAIEKNDSLNYAGSLDEIYLTKLAVATMANLDGPEIVNSIQKRDVPDAAPSTIIQFEEKQSKESTASADEERVTFNVKLYKDASVIGRPKSYNIEDLNLNNGVTEEVAYNGNIYKSALPANFKELYVDYIYGENLEDKTSISVTAATAVSSPITTVIPTIIISLSDYLNLTNFITNAIVDSITTSSLPTEATVESYIRLLANLSDNYNDTDQIIDELLSDPEMAQRIHQELDRLEHMSALTAETEGTTSSITDILSSIIETMSSVHDSMYTITSTAAKVRRDLREYPEKEEIGTTVQISENIEINSAIPEIAPVENIPVDNFSDPDVNRVVRQSFASEAEALNNITAERAPMLNMVMKYMPYLKSYETSFVGTTADRAYVFSPTFLLVLSLLNVFDLLMCDVLWV